MAVNNVCRLCMSDKELVWVFDQRFGECEKNMKNVVMVTTGVEIQKIDTVSQNICCSCCTLTIKMFDFRERALKTDKYLKNQCKELLTGSEIAVKILNTSVSIIKEMNTDFVQIKSKPPICKKSKDAKENKLSLGESTAVFCKTDVVKAKKPTDVKSANINDVQKKTIRDIHPSINQIFSTYADIKIPTGCLKFNVNPVVSMQINGVEEYFRRKKVDVAKPVHRVLRTLRGSKKYSVSNPSTKKNHENTKPIIEDNKPGTSKDISPISIRLDVTDHVNKRKSVDVNDSEYCTVNKTLTIKRRRLSSSNLTSSPEPIHPTLMETLELRPKENILMHRCRVCDITQINGNVLKKYYLEHFICSYCKTNFRLIEYKKKHERTCAFKNALTCKVSVKLKRLDFTKYQLKSLKDTRTEETFNLQETHKTNKHEIIELPVDKDNTTPSASVNNTPQVHESMPPSATVLLPASVNNMPQVQENMSPCSTVLLPASVNNTPQVQENMPPSATVLLPASVNNMPQVQENMSPCSTVLLPASVNNMLQLQENMPVQNLVFLIAQLDNSTPQGPENVHIPKLVSLLQQQTINPGTKPVPNISPAIVKPSIQINDNHVLNTIDTSSTDMKVLKEIITQTGTINMKLTVDGETQTTLLPSNKQILINRLYGTAELKNLLAQLYAFKVPIDIKHGDFNISYTKNKQQIKKKIFHWGNLKPEDITGNRATDLNVNLNRRLSQGISLFDKTPNLNYSLIEKSQTNNLSPTNNNQMNDSSQINQVLPNLDPISNGKTHTPGQNNNSPMYTLPKSVQTSNVQAQHKLPQQVQTHQLTKAFPIANTPQVPNLTSNINTYFVQSSGKNASSQIVNTTNNNMQGFVNILTNTPSTQQNMNLSLTFSNSSSVIKTIPLTIQSSAGKAPSTNSSNSGTNSNMTYNTNVNNLEKSVHKPQIRVTNLYNLK